jgi:hypothetical protein
MAVSELGNLFAKKDEILKLESIALAGLLSSTLLM